MNLRRQQLFVLGIFSLLLGCTPYSNHYQTYNSGNSYYPDNYYGYYSGYGINHRQGSSHHYRQNQVNNYPSRPKWPNPGLSGGYKRFRPPQHKQFNYGIRHHDRDWGGERNGYNPQFSANDGKVRGSRLQSGQNNKLSEANKKDFPIPKIADDGIRPIDGIPNRQGYRRPNDAGIGTLVQPIETTVIVPSSFPVQLVSAQEQSTINQPLLSGQSVDEERVKRQKPDSRPVKAESNSPNNTSLDLNQPTPVTPEPTIVLISEDSTISKRGQLQAEQANPEAQPNIVEQIASPQENNPNAVAKPVSPDIIETSPTPEPVTMQPIDKPVRDDAITQETLPAAIEAELPMSVSQPEQEQISQQPEPSPVPTEATSPVTESQPEVIPTTQPESPPVEQPVVEQAPEPPAESPSPSSEPAAAEPEQQVQETTQETPQ